MEVLMQNEVMWSRAIEVLMCSKCHKLIKPGRKVAVYKNRLYCYRHGNNLELSNSYRSLGSGAALAHLREINNMP